VMSGKTIMKKATRKRTASRVLMRAKIANARYAVT